MTDDEPVPKNDSSSSDSSPESPSEEPQSLSDTEADLEEFLGSQQPQGEKRINFSSQGRKRRP